MTEPDTRTTPDTASASVRPEAPADGPLLTIAIPTYNNADSLGATVASALGQSDIEDCEVLVVNNASTDATATVLQQYQGHPALRIVTNDQTVGLWENHNVCFRQARGRYVLFCHADDTLDRNAVRALKRKLEERDYPERYIVWGHSLLRDYMRVLGNAGLTTGKLFAGLAAALPFLNSGLTPSGTCYSREFIDHGGFFPAANLAPSDTSSMVWAALNGFRFEMMEELVYFRHQPSTALPPTERRARAAYYRTAWQPLLEQIDDRTALELVRQSQAATWVNPAFYACLAERVPREVALRMVIKLLVSPIHGTRPSFWKALIRCLFVRKRG